MDSRIAIVGGGTTGFMAAAHLSRALPDARLTSILDPRIPTIGVGEGTTPGFRTWLDDLTHLPFDALERALRVTKKRGIRFENWGKVNAVYAHDFVPTETVGLHLSARELVVFLREYVRGEIVEAHVTDIEGLDSQAVVRLEGRPDLVVDVAIDARGFPRALGDEHIPLAWIPTNAALVTRTPTLTLLEWTRAVARPHGWIFGISLTEDTAYGYIFGSDTATEEEVRRDFDAFLAAEGIKEFTPPRRIDFPNFVCKRPFRNRVLKLGNAASFIEPLEATAIAITRYELNYLTAWMQALEAARGGRIASVLVETLNRKIVELVTEVSLFVSWHYAEGSPYDTRFWRDAPGRFRHGLEEGVPEDVRARFRGHVDHGMRLRDLDIAAIRTPQDLDRLVPQHREFPRPFGGMTPLGFAQVARGIAYERESEASR